MSRGGGASLLQQRGRMSCCVLFSWVGHSVTGVERSRQEAVTGLELLSLLKHHRSKRDETQTLLCSKYIFIDKKAQDEPNVPNMEYSGNSRRDSSQENK
jgi:hypothetical protein